MLASCRIKVMAMLVVGVFSLLASNAVAAESSRWTCRRVVLVKTFEGPLRTHTVRTFLQRSSETRERRQGSQQSNQGGRAIRQGSDRQMRRTKSELRDPLAETILAISAGLLCGPSP